MSKELIQQSMSLVDNAIQVLTSGGATVEQVTGMLGQVMQILDKCYSDWPTAAVPSAAAPAGTLIPSVPGSAMVRPAVPQAAPQAAPAPTGVDPFNPFAIAREIFIQAQVSNNPTIQDAQGAYERAVNFVESMREIQQAIATGLAQTGGRQQQGLQRR